VSQRVRRRVEETSAAEGRVRSFGEGGSGSLFPFASGVYRRRPGRMLASAGAIKGRTVTFPSIKDDIINAGGHGSTRR
jgi:hypothetical protein